MTAYNSEPHSEVLETVQDLLSLNVDSEKGFEEAAENTNDASLKSFFREMGARRHRNAEELETFLVQNGKSPSHKGTTSGALHRWWIDAKQAIMGGDAASVLSEAERGEDSIKDEYQKALRDTRGHNVHALLEQQFANVREGHDMVRDLRDRYKNPS